MDANVLSLTACRISTFPARCAGFGFPICSLIPQATPLTDEACETDRSLGRTASCWEEYKRFFRTVRSRLASFSVSSRRAPCACAPCVGVRRAMVLIGDAGQAMSEGKSGSVELDKPDQQLRPCSWGPPYIRLAQCTSIGPGLHAGLECSSSKSGLGRCSDFVVACIVCSYAESRTTASGTFIGATLIL